MVLAGEIVCLDPNDGRSIFENLFQHRTEPHFYAFDLLSLEGLDLQQVPLLQTQGPTQSDDAGLAVPSASENAANAMTSRPICCAAGISRVGISAGGMLLNKPAGRWCCPLKTSSVCRGVWRSPCRRMGGYSEATSSGIG